MKKLLSVLLIAAIMLCAIPAFAAEYKNTERFMTWLDNHGIEYETDDILDNGFEPVIVAKEIQDIELDLLFFFSEEEDAVCVRAFYIIEYDSEDFVKVMQVCNQLNYEYKYCRFYCDETDNTVTCSMDVIVRDNEDTGAIAGEALELMEALLDRGITELKKYDK